MRRTLILLVVLLGWSVTARAQGLYRITFKGNCSGADTNGHVFSQAVNNKTLIREFASRAGVSNVHNLDLVFHLNASPDGDAIEVINRKTGELVVTVFPISFPEVATAETPFGITERRFAYVYNIYDPGFSRGTTIINEHSVLNKNGQITRTVLDGDMQWYQLAAPDKSHPFRICTGKFNVHGRRLSFN